MRNLLSGALLPVWPAGPATILDTPRQALNNLLGEFVDKAVAIYHDDSLSDAGKSARLKPLAEGLKPLLREIAQRAVAARAQLDVRGGAIDTTAGPTALVDALRQREVRDFLAGRNDRSEIIERVIIAGDDAETLRAIVSTPTLLRGVIVSDDQQQRARNALWKLTDPASFAEVERLRDVLPIFEATVREAAQFIDDIATSGPARLRNLVADRESARLTAEGVAQLLATRDGTIAAAGA